MNRLLLVNLDSLDYLDPMDFGEPYNFTEIVNGQDGSMMALALLLADSNNRGGGDLRSNHPAIGAWAGAHIVLADESTRFANGEYPALKDALVIPACLAHGENRVKDIREMLTEGGETSCMFLRLNMQCGLPAPAQRKALLAFIDRFLTFGEDSPRVTRVNDFLAILGARRQFTSDATLTALQASFARVTKKYGVRLSGVPVGYEEIQGPHRGVLANCWKQRPAQYDALHGVREVVITLEHPTGRRSRHSVLMDPEQGLRPLEVANLFFADSFDNPFEGGAL